MLTASGLLLVFCSIGLLFVCGFKAVVCLTFGISVFGFSGFPHPRCGVARFETKPLLLARSLPGLPAPNPETQPLSVPVVSNQRCHQCHTLPVFVVHPSPRQICRVGMLEVK